MPRTARSNRAKILGRKLVLKRNAGAWSSHQTPAAREVIACDLHLHLITGRAKPTR